MTVYIVQYFVWFIVCREALKKRLRILPDRTISGRMLCVFVFFFYVALISGLRSTTIGVDTPAYSQGYTRVARAESLYDLWQKQDKSEFAFVTIEYFLGFISTSPHMYVFAFSLIIAVSFAFYIYRDSANVWYSCWLYIGVNAFYYGMTAMKQYTATGIAMNAYLDLTKSLKSIRGWILFLIAVGIHPTCIAFLPAVFFSRFSERHSVKMVTVSSVVLSVLAFISISILYDMFISMFPGYEMYGEGVLEYKDEEHGNYMLYLFLLCVSLSHTVRRWHSPVSSKYYMAAVFCGILGTLFYRNSQILRIIRYYMNPFICFIPESFEQYPKKERKILYTITFIPLFYYSIRYVIFGMLAITPYSFFFLED